MTIRDAFENCLIELNKVQAPTLLIDDFIYFFNKAIQQYVNERYMLFESKQQITDDLRVLLKTVLLKPDSQRNQTKIDPGYWCYLPSDYLHILNCICQFEKVDNDRCADQVMIIQGANKLDTDKWPHIINNYYMKPSVKRPYYYIINTVDPNKSESDDTLYLRNQIVDRGKEKRYGNSTLPIMLIKCGNDPKFNLDTIYVDYLRAPEYLSLTQEQLDTVEDNTQVIEFPDYVIYEIINKIITLCLENETNPRIQTHVQINPPLK